MKIFEKAIFFIENLGKDESIVLIYHDDCDGVCSAALMISTLKAFGKKLERAIPLGIEKIGKLNEIIKDFDKVILLDLPIASLEKKLHDVKKPILIIDHHPYKNMKYNNVFFINPLIEDPNVYKPTSYLIYKIFSKKLKKRKWIACVGTVGDFGIKDCGDLVKIKDGEKIWESKFGKAANVVNSCLSLFGPEKTLERILASNNLNDFLRKRDVILAFENFEKEMKRCEDEFKTKLESYGKVIISEIKPKYKRVGSALTTKIATNYPDKIIIVFEDAGKFFKVHGRCRNDKIHIGRIFEKIGIGGGHKNAGGGIIKKIDKNKVKTKILEELKDFTGLKS